MSKKKYILFTCFFALLFISFGISSWIIIDEAIIKPSFVKSNTLASFFADGEATYNGLHYVVSPTGDLSELGITNDDLKYEFSNKANPSSSDFVEFNNIQEGTGPIDAGDYKIRISKKDNTDSTVITLNILPYPVYLSNDPIEMDYNTKNSSWAGFNDANFEESVKQCFVDENKNPIPLNIGTDEFKINGMENGTFYYGTIKNTVGLEDGTKTAPKHIIGSTYNAYIEFEKNNSNKKSNYQLIGKSTQIVKYKTAKVSDKYYTIEDAILNTTGDITLEGNSSAADSYIVTAFTNLYNEEGNPYGTFEFNIQNRNLQAPFESTNIEETETDNSYGNNVFSTLMISPNVILNLVSGNIIASAYIKMNNTQTTNVCSRGIIINNGTINVNSGSEIRAYGYIKGQGLININENGTAIDCMTTYDWPGGATAGTIYSKVLPLNAWTLHNISCETIIDANANYKAFFFTNTSAGDAKATASIFSNAGNCLFKGINGYIRKTVSKAVNWDSNYASSIALSSITGSNQIAGQKDIFELYGDYEDSILRVQASSVDMKTSTSIACPLGYANIILKINPDKGINETNLNLLNSDYLFLPGTSLIVENGANLTTQKNVDLSFEALSNTEQVKSSGRAFYNYCIDKFDAQLIVNGTFTCNGNIGGLVSTTSSSGKLDFKNATITSSFFSLYNGIGGTSRGSVGYGVKNFYAKGLINSTDSVVAFTNSEYISSNENENFIWLGDTGSNSNLNGTFDKDAITKSCIVEGTLITMADGSKKKVEDLKIGDKVLVFNHETGKWDYAPILVVAHKNDEKILTNILNLQFDNGSIFRIVGDHGLFDLKLNQYIYITEDNVKEYYNHPFASSSGEGYCTLINSYITEEYVSVYSPASVWHLNLVAEDLLTLSSGMVNFFEYDENMKYDETSMVLDIEKYGLYTYDDFKDYISIEVFNAFPFKYFKVAVGKELTTYEWILELINYYYDAQ